MKRNNSRLALTLFALLMAMVVSCGKQETAPPSNEAKAAPAMTSEKNTGPAQLPVRFQSPSYYIHDEQAADVLGEESDDYQIKVGAKITSTKGPQPLWDILKRVANLKQMSVSWASDVDQNVLVDVNINADDNFFEAIDNMLRQVDYFHEVEGNTIVVKYRETQQFQIAIPNVKGTYKTTVGGDFIGSGGDVSGTTGDTKGLVQIESEDNTFDVWQNINDNLVMIIDNWRTQQTEQEDVREKQKGQLAGDGGTSGVKGDAEGETSKATRRVSLGQPYFTVDRSIGQISVTAPRPLMEKISFYLGSLKKQLYRQVIIEAKIIEVNLLDHSKIGIDWGQVLENFAINGLVEFGTGGVLGQIWPWNPPEFSKKSANYQETYPDKFIYRVGLNSVSFTAMLNALNEQGNATVLSNPKITALNGQPAVLSVGKGSTYIKKVKKTVTKEGDITYAPESATVVEGVALGIIASIVGEDTVNLYLTPITTNLLEDPIQTVTFADGTIIGLPKISVREMSTMVQIKNGEMLIIGGLIDSVDRKDGNFAPGLGDIPLIRYLFGYEEKVMQKRELVILLTPKII